MNRSHRISILAGAAVMMLAVSLSATEFSTFNTRAGGIEITLD